MRVSLTLAAAAHACPADCGSCVAYGGGNGCVDRCAGCAPECATCLTGGSGLECMQYCTPIYQAAEAIIRRSAVAQNTWTLMLTNRWGNLTYYAKDADVGRIPASNTKVWTTSCAYETIGYSTVWPWDDDHTIQQGCKDILKPSWNEGADNLLSFIGDKVAHASTAQGAADYVLKWASEKVGINMTGAAMGDGCGLDRDNKFTARQMTKIFRHMLDTYTGWEPALPIGCVDGTLAHRFCTADGDGRVHAKTGTLHDVHAVSGYVVNRHDGQTYLFSAITNNCDPDYAAESVQAIDDIAILMGGAGIPNPVGETHIVI